MFCKKQRTPNVHGGYFFFLVKQNIDIILLVVIYNYITFYIYQIHNKIWA